MVLTFLCMLDTMTTLYSFQEDEMADLPKLSDRTFESEVLKAEIPVLVDFTAVWCGPCKMLDPIIQQLALDWQGKAKIMKLDVDDNPHLAMDYQVMGVPTLMLFKNGKPVERVTGYQPKDRLEKKFQPHLK
jgi:thioredoxin 1